uniref:Uncharacterized protein n=1 Tax=Arundo donax TaxID=35708 RepID=A0A0A9AX65_ARUDO
MIVFPLVFWIVDFTDVLSLESHTCDTLYSDQIIKIYNTPALQYCHVLDFLASYQWLIDMIILK